MVVGYERFPDRYALVDGLRIRYWDEGEGPSIVLVHGLGASVEFWGANIAPLARDFRVLAFDVPGFGRSDKVLPVYSLEYVVDFVGQFLKAIGAGRSSLIGNSMGGLISLRFALDRSDLIDKLVLVNSGGLGRELCTSLRLLAVPVLGEVMVRGMGQMAVQHAIRGVCYDPSMVTSFLLETACDLLGLPSARDAALRVARIGVGVTGQKREIVLLDRLAELSMPTLIVWGREDRVIPASHALAAHRRIRGSKLHIFERCGHCPQIERPKEFNALVGSFLSGLDRSIPAADLAQSAAQDQYWK